MLALAFFLGGRAYKIADPRRVQSPAGRVIAPTHFRDLMMNPSQWTLGEISSAVRDLGIFGALATVVWKSRGGYDIVKKFFLRCIEHMDTMEAGMKTLLENHVKHIEADLAKIAGRTPEEVKQHASEV